MKNMKKKAILMLAAMALLLTVTVGSTIAYLWAQTDSVENKFEPAKVASSVQEPGWKDGNTVKQNVTIKNEGNIDAKIRAAIVVTWQDADGNTMPSVPALGTDYSLTIGEGWEKKSGFYYWNAAVAPGGETGVLITKCESIGSYNDGRKLCVEVIGSAIQAEGGADWGTKPGNAQ